VLPQGAKSLLPFDILRVGIHILRGWKWIILAGLLGGSGAFFVGWKEFTTKYTVQVQMVRQETQNNFQASRMGEILPAPAVQCSDGFRHDEIQPIDGKDRGVG
jgi:hypothetical protein